MQIADPIEEEKVKRAIMEIRDLQLASAMTDLGGGGLSSAVGETAEKYDCGVTIDLAGAIQVSRLGAMGNLHLRITRKNAHNRAARKFGAGYGNF